MTDVLKELKNKLDWLSTHNKNYTKQQYYMIMDCVDAVDKLLMGSSKIDENVILDDISTPYSGFTKRITKNGIMVYKDGKYWCEFETEDEADEAIKDAAKPESKKPVKEYTIKKKPGYQDMLIFDKGEIYETESGKFEVLDQLGDYVLLKNTNEKSFTPYIVADFPMKRSWAQGHYFRTYEDALDDFNERTSDVG